LINYRCRQIGFVFQSYNLIPNLTALENVMLPMEFAGKNKAESVKRATHLLDQVGLSAEKHARKPPRLSGGEQQRVAIARALANKPQLILADEPTGNLDSQTGAKIVELLRGLATTENTTIVAVTHDLAIAEQTDLTFRLQDGKLVANRPASHKN
ncbi:ATP-binding cassette domain-containing protein, partial [Candidatus Saccharibacteria bacterium]|nr:ATP-binding cassette domain-containing protein [Candidatus Saccharibacteria bacterium]